MPVLPDVRSSYNVNVGNQPDTSGEDHIAKTYGDIANFSSEVGNFATGVARDINQKSSAIESTQKITQYNSDLNAKLDSMSRDPNLDFVNNSRVIEKDFMDNMEYKRKSIIDSAQSNMSRDMLERQFASSRGEEAMQLLKLKNKRINEALDLEKNNIMDSYGSAMITPDADFNRANEEMKKSMVRLSSVYGDYFTPEQHQQFQQKISSFGGVNAMNNMIMTNRAQEAGAQLLGSNYPVLWDHIKKNYAKGQDAFIGIGLRDESNPGHYRVHMPNNLVVDYYSSEEQWKKSPYMLSKEFTKWADNVFVDSSPTNELIKYASPQAKEEMYNKLFKALASKPKQDSSLAVKINKNASELVMKGKLQPEHMQSLMADETLSNLNDGQLSEAANTVVLNKVMTMVNQIPKEKISTQEDIIQGVGNYLDDLEKNIDKDPDFQKIATYVGKGNMEVGIAKLKQTVLSKPARDSFLEAADKRRIQLKADFEKDPVKVAEDSLGETPQTKQILKKLFADGAIKQVNGLNPDEYKYMKTHNEQVQTKMKKLGDSFGMQDKVVNADTEQAIKNAFEASFSDTNQLVGLVDNLKKIYGPEQFANLMNQVGQTPVAVALESNNFQFIEEITKANKWFKQYRSATLTPEGEDPIGKQIAAKLYSDDTFNNFINASLRGAKSSQPLAVQAMKDSAFRLTYFYMKDRGLGVEDAQKLAVQRLIGDNNEILSIQTGGWFSKNRDYNAIVDKKYKLKAEDLKDAFDSTVGDEDWVDSKKFMIPPEMSKDPNSNMVIEYSRFVKDVVDNATVINTNDGSGFILGFKDKETKRFIPLRTAEGEQAVLSIAEIKRVRAIKNAQIRPSLLDSLTNGLSSAISPDLFVNSELNPTGKKISSPIPTPKSTPSSNGIPIVPPLLKSPENRTLIDNTPIYRIDTKMRSTENFVNDIQKWEVDNMQKWENADMEKNWRVVYGVDKHGKRLPNAPVTLGGAMTGPALVDTAKKLNIPIPPDKKTNEDIVKYFAATTQTKAQYDNLFKTYMQLNRSYIAQNLKGLPPAKKNALEQIAWVLGAGVANHSGVAKLLHDDTKTPNDIMNFLKNSSFKTKDMTKTTGELAKSNFFTSIGGNMEPNRRLRSLLKWN